MNIDEPKFTAYALDALSPEEKEACEPGVLADAEALREAELTAAFAEKLKGAFTSETNARLSAAHWREIYAEAGVEQAPGAIPFESEPQKRFPLWALSAAAGVMFGAVIASLAITWNDRPALIADVPVRPDVRDAAMPEPTVPQPQQPDSVKVSVPPPVVQKNAPTVVVVPRPQVPAVVANFDPTPTKAIEIDDSDGVVAVVTNELDAPPVEAFASNEESTPIDAPSVEVRVPRAVPYFPPLRSTVQSTAPTVVPKPTVAAPVVQPAPGVAANRPVASASSALEKKPAIFAFNTPPAKKITVTIPNTTARKNGAASSSAPTASLTVSSDIETQLSTLRLGATLDDVKAAGFDPAVSGFVSTASGAVSVGVPFAMVNSADSDTAVFVNVLLNNSGLPLWLTPGNTKVLDVSDPYFLQLKP
jgi:hypothetical protein